MSDSIYYKIRLDPPPQVLKALNNRKANYLWCYTPHDFFCATLEIQYLQEGSLNEMRADGEHTYEQGTVHTMVLDRQFQQYSKDPILHEFNFVFHLRTMPEAISAADVAAWQPTSQEAILPDRITDPVISQQIGNLIKSVVGVHRSDRIARDLQLQAVLYECLLLVTEQSIQQAKQQLSRPTPSHSIQSVCEYIRAHLHEKLKVEEVARAVGANYNHLKRVFCREMNMTMVDYINHARIQQVEKLITVGGLSLADAGKTVGIHDANYLSRLFRQHTGITAREYRQVYKECTHAGFAADGTRIDD